MKAKWELNNNHWALGENMGIHLGTQNFQRIPFISPHPFPQKGRKKNLASWVHVALPHWLGRIPNSNCEIVTNFGLHEG
jgi:hypothetical protein